MIIKFFQRGHSCPRPHNTEYTDNFPYDKTQLNLYGKRKFLTDEFEVDRTN